MATEERLEQLERSLQQAGSALQAANYRISSLETAAGTTTSWKSWSFVMLSFSAAVSPELRALMEKARINVDDMLNVHLTSAEEVWSRQLYYMLSLSTSGEVQRRLQNVPEGEGAEAWKVFSEHYEPKTATRYVGMLRQILLYDFGELTQLIDRIEQFRHLVRKYEEQSGESVTDNVRQAVFQAGIKDAAIRDHLALHAGRLNSFDKMAAEVSTVARTRSENDVVPMDVSVIKGKGGKGKDGKGKEGKSKEGKGKTKAKEDKEKLDSKSNPNKFKKCFYCDKVGHVRADCKKKKRDDEERRNVSPQNSLNASSAAPSPPGLTNVTTSTSGASSSSLRQLTIPSYVSEEEFHSPMRIFALRYNSNVDRVMVDSGAAHSACPSDYANEHEVREVQRKIQFQTASGELLEHHGEKLVPYMAQDSVMGITYQVTDVEGPVAAVSSMNDGGMTVVFSPQGAWVCPYIFFLLFFLPFFFFLPFLFFFFAFFFFCLCLPFFCLFFCLFFFFAFFCLLFFFFLFFFCFFFFFFFAFFACFFLLFFCLFLLLFFFCFFFLLFFCLFSLLFFFLPFFCLFLPFFLIFVVCLFLTFFFALFLPFFVFFCLFFAFFAFFLPFFLPFFFAFFAFFCLFLLFFCLFCQRNSMFLTRISHLLIVSIRIAVLK